MTKFAIGHSSRNNKVLGICIVKIAKIKTLYDSINYIQSSLDDLGYDFIVSISFSKDICLQF